MNWRRKNNNLYKKNKNIINGLSDGMHPAYSIIDDKFLNKPENIRSIYLREYIKDDIKLFENDKERNYKENVLISLYNIIQFWMKKLNEKLKKNQEARLLCFGSYKLAVSNPGGDIDTLILAPNYVKRDENFFGDFYDILKNLQEKNKEIKDLNAINLEHTIMPLIKMEFKNIQIDMVFASVEDVSCLDKVNEIIPVHQNNERIDKFYTRNNLYNNSLLIKMDDKMKRSYNGFRNAEMIWNSIVITCSTKKERNDRKEKFRYLLKFIKYWAKKKGIDSNKSGYLGGIAWAILCAKIVQLFPNYTEYLLIERFFFIYSEYWKWDEWIVEIENEDMQENKPLKLRYMHILTPSYPQMNASYNINYTSRKIILSRMKEALHLIKSNEIKLSFINEKKENSLNLFNKILEEYDFFNEYDDFIEIIILGNNWNEFLKYRGFIEAKIRLLIERLEKLMKIFSIKFHLWPFKEEYDPNDKTLEISKKLFEESIHLKNFEYYEKIYIGFKLSLEYLEPVDLNYPIIKFLRLIEKEWVKENGKRDKESLNIWIHHVNKIKKKNEEELNDEIKLNKRSNLYLEKNIDLIKKLNEFKEITPLIILDLFLE